MLFCTYQKIGYTLIPLCELIQKIVWRSFFQNIRYNFSPAKFVLFCTYQKIGYTLIPLCELIQKIVWRSFFQNIRYNFSPAKFVLFCTYQKIGYTLIPLCKLIQKIVWRSFLTSPNESSLKFFTIIKKHPVYRRCPTKSDH